MSQKPKISIITPSFNQAKFLRRTIESVLEQDYPNLEYIVMDGGSTDGSLEIIREVADCLSYWESIPDEGQTDAINKGFARASGKYLAWLNSDDVYQPGAIREAVSYLESHPDVGMVYGDCTFIDAQDRKIGRFPAAQTNYQRLRRGYVHIPQQSSFFRASLWNKVGPLDPSFYFAMDYDLWVRLAREAPLVYLPGRHWASFRLHGDAKTIAADARCWPEMLRVHFREGGCWLSPIVLKYTLRKLAAPFINWRRGRKFIKRRDDQDQSIR
jgi:glycosyltransferase involved in cell wall biosynthesis